MFQVRLNPLWQTLSSLSRRRPIRLLLPLLSVIGTLLLVQLNSFDGPEWAFDDLRVSLAARVQTPHPDIVVISIDDETITRLSDRVGRYSSWPRSLYAGILDYCSDADVVAFDIFFSEEDQLFGDGDTAFVDAVIATSNVVSSMYLFADPRRGRFRDTIEPFALPMTTDLFPNAPAFDVAQLPFPSLLISSHGVGHVNHVADRDGHVRQYPQIVQMRNRLYPSLALAAVRARPPHPAPVSVDPKTHTLTLHEARLHLGDDASMFFVPKHADIESPTGRFPYPTYSMAEVLYAFQQEQRGTPASQLSITRADFAGKIVFIGMTATGTLTDRRITAVGKNMPGVFIHAMAADNLLQGHSFRKSPPWITPLLVALLGLLPLAVHRQRPVALLLGCTGMAAVFALSTVVIATNAHLILPVSAPIFSLFLTMILLAAVYWAAEQEHRRALQQLERDKQQFTDMLVHDLKGGISSIAMSMSMMASAPPSKPERRERLVTTMKTSVDRLLGQIHALLDIRRMEEGKMPLSRQTTHLHDFIRNSLNDFQSAATLVNLTIEERYDPAVNQAVYIDRDVVQRILGNLIWNALQYARKNSVIVVATHLEDRHLKVSISNEGRLIPPETMATLFTPFVSGGDEDKNVRTVSTGLGLAFCKMAMEAHQGHIEAFSPCNGHDTGAEFVLSFPLEKP